MRRKYSRIVAIAMAAVAGGLAAFALRPAAGTSTATLAARNPAVEVRTQVIRRTIHVIRHESGARAAGRAWFLGAGDRRARRDGQNRARAAGIGRRTPPGRQRCATRASGAHRHDQRAEHRGASTAPVAALRSSERIAQHLASPALRPALHPGSR